MGRMIYKILGGTVSVLVTSIISGSEPQFVFLPFLVSRRSDPCEHPVFSVFPVFPDLASSGYASSVLLNSTFNRHVVAQFTVSTLFQHQRL